MSRYTMPCMLLAAVLLGMRSLASATQNEDFKAHFMHLTSEWGLEHKVSGPDLANVRIQFVKWAERALSDQTAPEIQDAKQKQLLNLKSLGKVIENADPDTSTPSWNNYQFRENNKRVKEIWENENMTCAKAFLDDSIFKGLQQHDRCHTNLKKHKKKAGMYETLRHTCPEICMDEQQKRCDSCVKTMRWLLGEVLEYILCYHAPQGAHLPASCEQCYMSFLVECGVAEIVHGATNKSDTHVNCDGCTNHKMSGCALKFEDSSEICAIDESLNNEAKCNAYSSKNPGDHSLWCQTMVVVDEDEEW